MHDEPEIAERPAHRGRAHRHAAVVPGRADAQPAAAPDAPPRRAHAGGPAAGPGRDRPHGRRAPARRRVRRAVLHRPPPGRHVRRAGGGRGAAPQLVAVRRAGDPGAARVQGRPGADPAGARRGQGDPRLPPARAPVARGAAGHRRAVGVGARRHRRAEAQGLAAARLDHHRPADRLRHRPALRLRQPPARGRRHHLALPPLSPLPPRHVGAVAQLRPPGRRHPGLPGRHARASPLVELPGPRPRAGASRASPGFPWFIDGVHPQKSPPPPALLDAHMGGRRRLLEMGLHTPARARRLRPGRGGRPTARGRCSSTSTG